MAKFALLAALGLAAVVMIGCSSDKSGDEGGGAPTAEGAKFLLSAEPQGARGVEAARKDAKDGDEIVVVGRIGGDPDPWIDGHAAFTIVDEALKPCNEREGDSCTTPWDYCCDLDVLADNSAFVEFVDDGGTVVKTGAKDLLALKELETVVVRGTAKRDDRGNLTVQANGVFVRK